VSFLQQSASVPPRSRQLQRRSTRPRANATALASVQACALLRAASPLTGVAKNTIVRSLVDLGAAVTKYQDETLRNLPCKRLQSGRDLRLRRRQGQEPVRRRACHKPSQREPTM
jgi:hypothetical protein